MTSANDLPIGVFGPDSSERTHVAGPVVLRCDLHHHFVAILILIETSALHEQFERLVPIKTLAEASGARDGAEAATIREEQLSLQQLGHRSAN